VVAFFVSISAATLSFFLYKDLASILFAIYKTNLGHNFYIFVNRKWLFDKLQNELISVSLLRFGYSTTYKVIDKGFIELFGPSGLSKLVVQISRNLSNLQSGLLNHYAFFIFIGAIFFTSISILFALFSIYIEVYVFFLLLVTWLLLLL